MTEQEPPPYRPYPTAPPSRPGELQPSRAGDVATAWILWVVLLLTCIGVWGIMLLAGLSTGIECSSGTRDDEICSGRAADVAQSGYFTMWLVMATAVFVSLVMTIVSVNRRRLAWVWPAGAFGVVLLSFLVWKVVYDSVA